MRRAPFRDQRNEFIEKVKDIQLKIQKDNIAIKPLPIKDSVKQQILSLDMKQLNVKESNKESTLQKNSQKLHEITLSFRIISKYPGNYTRLKQFLLLKYPGIILDVIPQADIKTRVKVISIRSFSSAELLKIVKKLGHCRILGIN